MLYKIGEFSRITRFSIRTLRYYHDNHILQPDHIDEASGYRYYSDTAFKKAKLIHLLRDFEFSIKEIKEILDNYEDEEDIKYYLLEKNDMIQEKIDHYKKLQKRIMAFDRKEDQTMTTQDVKKVTIPDTLVASITYVGRYEDVGIHLGKLFKAIKSNVKDKPFCIYHDEDYREDNARIEVCIPIKRDMHYGDIECKTIKGGSGLSITHIGPYEKLSISYKALTDYMIQHKLESKSHMREHYHKGPGMLLKGNPEKYITEIQILI